MRSLAILVLSVCAPIATSGFAATSTFSASSEGWTIVSFNNLSGDNYGVMGTYASDYHAAGGNPGGFISASDPDSGDFTFSAPAAFLGSSSPAYNTNLTYDLASEAPQSYVTTDVILTGAGSRLLYIPSPTVVPTASFQTVTVPLATTSAWHVNSTGGPQPTALEFQSVLANLTGLYIRGEYANGPEVTNLDNVNTVVPEPSCLAIVPFAAAALRRRRRLQA